MIYLNSSIHFGTNIFAFLLTMLLGILAAIQPSKLLSPSSLSLFYLPFPLLSFTYLPRNTPSS